MIHVQIKEHLKKIKKIEQRNYIKEVFETLQKEGKKAAYHGFCTDGAISASLIKYLGWAEVFVPLEYNILKNETLRPFLTSIDWSIILDLEPFNEKVLDLYVDHHRSVMGQKINAKSIHYEVGELGPSAAFVLYNYAKSIKKIPDYLIELVEISKVTDTASFKIDPPTELIYLDKDKSFLDDFDKLCWFVSDATNIEDEYTLNTNNSLVYALAEGGVKSLLDQHTIHRVNKHRNKRIEAEKFIQSIDIAGIVIIINAPNNIFKQYAALKIGNKGSKIIIFLTKRETKITISLRQSKKNSKDEIEYFRLDKFAREFGDTGGGHAEAAGSSSPSIEEAFAVIENWGRRKKLENKIFTYIG